MMFLRISGWLKLVWTLTVLNYMVLGIKIAAKDAKVCFVYRSFSSLEDFNVGINIKIYLQLMRQGLDLRMFNYISIRYTH